MSPPAAMMALISALERTPAVWVHAPGVAPDAVRERVS